MVFIMGLQKNYGPDVGFHLQSAKWMLENHTIIKHDFFTYTSYGNNYYDLQWLYQFMLYALYKCGGDALLVVINALLITLSVFVVWLRVKKQSTANFLPQLFLLIVIVGMQALMFEVRPHVFSWLFLSLVLLILSNYKHGKAKQIYLLPPIMILWVNTHSLAILGLVVILIYGIGSYLEERKWDKQLLTITVVSVICFMLNPYFFEGFLFPLKQFGILKGNALQKTYIAELQTPFILTELKQQGLAYLLNPLFFMQLYSIIAMVVAIKLFIKKKIVYSLLIFSFFIILYMAIKNYGYFLFVSLPFVITALSDWMAERKKKKKQNEAKFIKRLHIASISLAILISWLSFTDGMSMLKKSPYRFGLSVDEQSVPVEATAFLNENKIYGKLLNHLDFGGYLMYNYPNRVFIDGRIELPKPDFFSKYFNSLKPGGIKNLLAEYNPDIIIFPYIKATGWWSYLIGNKNYRPVYFDGLAAVYLKNGTFENIPPLSADRIRTNTNENIYTLLNENKPSGAQAFLNSFYRKQYNPIAEENKATFCFTYNFGEAALQYSALGIRKATTNPKNIFYNLSLYFNSIKQYNEAAICAKKAK